MIFKAKQIHSDLCGNTWSTGTEYFIEAENVGEVKKALSEDIAFVRWQVYQIKVLTLKEALDAIP